MISTSMTVSVVIPTYKGSGFLADALGSIFAQTLTPREIILVDDASPDGTADLAELLAESSSVPMRVVRLPRNSGGPARPINVGIEAASGNYIAVLDQDDVFCPDKLAHQAAILARNPDIRLVAGRAGHLKDPGHLYRIPAFEQAFRRSAGCIEPNVHRVESFDMLRLLLVEGMFLTGYPGFLFRKKDWVAKGGADESLRIGSDLDTACWLSACGPIALSAHTCFLRREHGNNASSRQIGEAFRDFFEIRRRYTRLVPEVLDDPPTRRALAQESETYAYWLREAGRYRDALRYYVESWRIKGPNLAAALGVAKLPAHKLYRFLRSRPPVYTNWTMPFDAG